MTRPLQGTLENRDGAWVLTLTRDIGHPAERVWPWLTDPTHTDHTGCRLTLEQTMRDRDPAAMNAAGWHVCLDVLDGVASRRCDITRSSGRPRSSTAGKPCETATPNCSTFKLLRPAP